MSSSGHLPASSSLSGSRKRSRESSDSSRDGRSKRSRNSINRSGKVKNDIDNENSKEGAEIWIYTQRLEIFNKAQRSFKRKNNSNGGSAKARLVTRAKIPIFRHWILVAKFPKKTLWMEANKIDGKHLQSRNLDFEPEGVVEKSFIGKVNNVSVKKMSNLCNKSILTRKLYCLAGANCQSWVKGMLKRLELKVKLTIINGVMDDVASVLDVAKYSKIAK
ncbi:UNVERIFIED_CONTAM: hypothetical protein RMT77_013184 [Armadillidium vulgare]